MPAVIAGVHIAVALFFSIHALRSGRGLHWVLILFMFPAIGCALYLIAGYLPQVRRNPAGHDAPARAGTQHELHTAQEAFERTPTAFNEARLARAWLAQGRHDKAIEHYRHITSGFHANDTSFLKGLAAAQLEAGHAADAVATLDRLFAAEPGCRRRELALMYAEALAAARRPEAAQAFEAVVAADSSIEARCKYGQYLLGAGRRRDARQAFQQVLADARRGNHHSRAMNRQWISTAREALEHLGPDPGASAGMG